MPTTTQPTRPDTSTTNPRNRGVRAARLAARAGLADGGFTGMESLEPRQLMVADPVTVAHPTWFANYGAVVVDGTIDPSEWAGSAPVTRAQANRTDSAATVRMKYTELGLYLGIEVADQYLWADGGGEAVMVTFRTVRLPRSVRVNPPRDPQALVENYRLASAVNPRVILQEIIEGPDTSKRVYLSCYDARSQRIAHAMFRELRCNPVGFGPASVSEPVIDAETDAVCDAFLRSIGYAGICEIEMKWDSRDGRVKLIEANPRLSGGGDAAPYAGVDLCWLHYLDLIGQPVSPVAPAGNSFRHVVLRADAAAVPNYLAAGLVSWGDVVRSYRGPLAFYDLDRKDWRYSIETVLVSALTLLRSLWRNAARRWESP